MQDSRSFQLNEAALNTAHTPFVSPLDTQSITVREKALFQFKCCLHKSCMQVKDYWELSADARLALLSALVHTAADTEVVRQLLQDSGTEAMNESLARGLPLGSDHTGTSYYQLASDAGYTVPY